ncbi:MAG: CBS domain-containing protein [Magnetococcales bacterium]|nr:CBS domain-containing protein [Magnetococcales bacterium]
MRVAEVMTTGVVSVGLEASIPEIARTLTEHRISGVPVVDEAGVIVGMVSEGDLVDRIKKIHLPSMLSFLDAVIPVAGEKQFREDLRKMAAATAGELMTPDPVVVEDSASLEEAATLLSDHHIPLLPVVRAGELVGILGKRDVIRGMLGKDGL